MAMEKYTMIWVDSKEDTKDFAPIFQGLQGELLKNPSKYQVKQVLKAHPERPLLVCGHGDSTGVYNEDMTDYVLGKLNVHLLKELPYMIGIWCYAGNFADHYHLRGFFTSMFISNHEEATECGFGMANPETIAKENIKFSERINLLIHNQIPPKEWPVLLQQLAHIQNLEPDEAFVGYNYEALAWFDSK